MADDNHICSIDGHAFRGPEEQQEQLRFIREEGAKMLALFAAIDDQMVKTAIVELVKAFAAMQADIF